MGKTLFVLKDKVSIFLSGYASTQWVRPGVTAVLSSSHDLVNRTVK